MTYTFLRASDVAARFGVSVSLVYRWVREGIMPPPIRLGPRMSAWSGGELDAIAEARVAGRDDAAIRELVLALVAARQRDAA